MTAPTGSQAVYEVRQVSKVYAARGRTRGKEVTKALDDVSLSVLRGQTLGVVGESGSGKSTLVKLLMALDRPTSGEVLFEGRDISASKESQLRDFRTKAQIVFQDPLSSLDPRMKVSTILTEPLKSLGIGGDHQARVRELLAQVGISPSAATRFPHQFSGGQRQRIAIARALGPSPEVLVADEPVSALDVSVRAQILNLLSRLVREFNLTMVFVSHDMAVVRHLCSHLAVLYQGRLIEYGESASIFEHPAEEYTSQLIQAAPRISGSHAAGV